MSQEIAPISSRENLLYVHLKTNSPNKKKFLFKTKNLDYSGRIVSVAKQELVGMVLAKQQGELNGQET